MLTWEHFATADEFIQKIDTMQYPQELDRDWDGSCPCFVAFVYIGNEALCIEGRCWRVSSSVQQEMHLDAYLPQNELSKIGVALKKKLDAQQWYNTYRVVYRA